MVGAGCGGGQAPRATDQARATTVRDGAPGDGPVVDAAPADSAAPPDAMPATVTVTMMGVRFEPAELTIAPGTTVHWVNPSMTMPHTVTSGTMGGTGVGSLFNHVVRPNQTFDRVFKDEGVFPYLCQFHQQFGMVGKITVKKP
jgi:plastocyanin